ncbi:unnamed protein product [Urochloa humidicola]
MDGTPSESEAEDDNGGPRRQRRRASSPSFHGEAAAGAESERPSARDRLGPDASGVRHVARSVEADGSSSQATPLDSPPVDEAATAVNMPATEEPVISFETGIGALEKVLDSTQEMGPAESSWASIEGQTEVQPNSDQVLHEQAQTTSPSMDSPTLVCFAAASSVSCLKHERQPIGDTVELHDDTPLPGNVEDVLDGQPPAPPETPPSRVTWRPAEEVLPAEIPVELNQITVPTTEAFKKVYARRPKAVVTQTIQDSSPSTPLPTTATGTFIEQVSKPVEPALPIPTVKQQRRRQVYGGTEPPRRSRRIANLPPENQNPAATSVCRELGFTDADSKVTPAMVEKYTVFFKTPLKRNDVKVLAAMLHKELPDELPVQASEAIMVV